MRRWKKEDRQPAGCCCAPEQEWWRPRGEQGPEGGCLRDSHNKKKHSRDRQDGMDRAQYWKIKGTRRHDCHGWHALGTGKRQTRERALRFGLNESEVPEGWAGRADQQTISIWPPALNREIQNETPAEKKPVKWEWMWSAKRPQSMRLNHGNTGMKGEKEVKRARNGSQEGRRERWTHRTGCQERPSGFGFSAEPRVQREGGEKIKEAIFFFLMQLSEGHI